MYPRTRAQATPDKAAYIMANSGETVTFGELDARSSQGAHLLRSEGLGVDASMAILMSNHPRFFEVCWAAQRSGIHYTPISTHLTAGEIEYILRDCGARLLVASSDSSEVAREAAASVGGMRRPFVVGDDVDGFDRYEAAIAGFPTEPIADELEGVTMLYSSGTTGHPKGIVHAVGDRTIGTPPPVARGLAAGMFGFGSDTRYLSPAPSYHSAPLRFLMAMQRIGATAVIMEKFHPRFALELIERHRITHSQWVPTMFVRMMKLPESERRGFDLTSHQCALHAAAPCPIPVKQAMIEWWGPILHEYYAATEGNGSTAIDSEDWLRHPGSVGKASNCALHIADEDGNELPPGEIGTVYFSGGGKFEYHNDPDKTRDCRNERGWSTVGDMGYLDDDGYLYLTDRKANMIISGGVNIYPQEAENVLITHDKVADAAVFGVPNDEFGEEVKAVVQLAPPERPSAELERELIEFCRAQLAGIKCPRSIDFEEQLPRSETGKLYKRRLKERYWEGHETHIL